MYTAERNFVTTALRQMDRLEDMWAAPNGLRVANSENLSSHALSEIKKAAFTVEARGVYRAAVLCEDVLNRLGTESTTKLHATLAGLQHLILQYTDGLIEIDPDFNVPVREGEKIATLVETTSGTPTAAPSSQTTSTEIKDKESDETVRDKAIAVLTPLMKLVKDDKHTKALSVLMNPFKVETPSAAPVAAASADSVAFDGLMRPITNLILSEARHCGKNVSVSYAADFENVGHAVAEDLQNFLEIMCLNIVANGIPKPEGEQMRSAQISLTGQDKGEKLHLTLGWLGMPLLAEVLAHTHTSQVLEQLKKRGGGWDAKSSALTTSGHAQHSLQIQFPKVSTMKKNNMVDERRPNAQVRESGAG